MPHIQQVIWREMVLLFMVVLVWGKDKLKKSEQSNFFEKIFSIPI